MEYGRDEEHPMIKLISQQMPIISKLFLEEYGKLKADMGVMSFSVGDTALISKTFLRIRTESFPWQIVEGKVIGISDLHAKCEISLDGETIEEWVPHWMIVGVELKINKKETNTKAKKKRTKK